MRYLVLLLLLFGLEGKAQSYTFTLNECRVEATTGELRESFLVDRIRYFDRGDQTFIFDHESVLSVFDANITNYGRDSLKALIDIWIDSCNVVPIPTPPGPSALFANTTSFDANGIDEYVTVADADNLSFTDGAGTDEAFSISSWIYVETDQQGVVVAKDSTALQEYRLAYSTSANYDIYFLLYKSDGTAYIGREDDSGLALNQWNHITVTYSAATETSADIKIYRNGIQVDDADLTLGSYTGMTNTITPLTIGDKLVSLPLDGKIDQPTVFNKELTVSEIKELMALRDYSYFSDTASIISSWYMDAPDDLGVAGGVTDRFGSNPATGVNTTTADNLVPCITFPYDYSLDSSALYTNLTPFQDDSAYAEMGFAWDFDGTNEEITMGAGSAPLQFEWNDSFSLSFWVNHDVVTGNKGYISYYKSAFSYNGWAVINSSNVSSARLQFFFGSIGGPNVVRAYNNTEMVAGQFQHVTVTYDGSGLVAGVRFYINGVYDGASNTASGSTNITATPSYASALLKIGRLGTDAYYVNGKMDETIVFDKLLTADEVTTLYNSHGLIDPRDTDLSANIVGYWNGYNSTNTAGGVLDLSGNGNNGTPTNMDLADFQYDSPRSIFEADSAASFSFDASTEYLTAPDTDSLTMTTLAGTADTSFSVSFWAYGINVTTQDYFISKGVNPPNLEWYIRTDNLGDVDILLYDDSANAFIVGKIPTISFDYTNSINWLKWYHFTVTYDGSGLATGIQWYINGEIVTTNYQTSGTYTAMENLGGDVNIGGVGGISTWNGNLSNITVMKGIELDLCQVQEIYNDGSPQNPTDWTFYQPNFIHWRMNSGDDPATSGGVLDIIGNINGSGVNMDATNIDTELYPTN